MPDSKEMVWAADYDNGTSNEPNDAASEVDAQAANDSDPDGWQQYRRWISKAPAPKGRRTGVDPSLYTWKGYRTWTEQVKRNWSDS